MSARQPEPKHDGILIRGAAGDLWFLRDDYKAPKRVKNPKVARSLRTHLAPGHDKQLYTHRLPDEVIFILDIDFGPLWWCIGFLTAQRLKPARRLKR